MSDLVIVDADVMPGALQQIQMKLENMGVRDYVIVPLAGALCWTKEEFQALLPEMCEAFAHFVQVHGSTRIMAVLRPSANTPMSDLSRGFSKEKRAMLFLDSLSAGISDALAIRMIFSDLPVATSPISSLDQARAEASPDSIKQKLGIHHPIMCRGKTPPQVPTTSDMSGMLAHVH